MQAAILIILKLVWYFIRNILKLVLFIIITCFSKANLVHQHYAHYAHEYLIHQQLIAEWKSFFALPEEDQDWETGMIRIFVFLHNDKNRVY